VVAGIVRLAHRATIRLAGGRLQGVTRPAPACRCAAAPR
jgi:hypothetical protein